MCKGILRKFFVNEKGVEQTTEFAIENWWLTDTFSYLNETKTNFYIQAVENVEVMVIYRDDYDKLLEAHPKLEKYFRCVYQKAFAASQMRIKFLYDYSREELYHHFSKSQPEFLQRVPQYLIASYLNFTPEYLSEIRRKSIS
ncbi:Crp/Fnr family transcriptional regulator [Algoriphagus sp. D3-2-R+10]|uniref:Crp/Fnr family transcriptional regulator n=1 Tax=Algoriphagus aurantiacus TaxID=3103948 RepID=UPI002B40906B|nr:Crp/Fnr family transcriptional regulator [Algoriphagus sp. D3-2-R+10]